MIIEKVAGFTVMPDSISRRAGLSVPATLLIISNSKPDGFERNASHGWTAADKTIGFVFVAAKSISKCSAFPHTAALVWNVR